MKENPFSAENMKELSMNTVLNPDFSMGAPSMSENPYAVHSYYPGDSVNEHHGIEEANQMLSQEEIKQQNNNL